MLAFLRPLGFQWVMSRELQRLVLSIKHNYLTGDGDYNVLIRIQCLRHCTAFLLLIPLLWSGHICLHFYEMGGRDVKELQQLGGTR